MALTASPNTRTKKLVNYLIKVPASLFRDDGSSMDPLILKLEIFEFSLKSVLGLFGACNLLVQ